MKSGDRSFEKIEEDKEKKIAESGGDVNTVAARTPPRTSPLRQRVVSR